MKKVLFTIILSFLFISGLQSQVDFKFGVTGGLISSKLNSRIGIGALSIDSGELASGTGFYVGGAASLRLGEKFGLQPELTYAKAGNLEFVQLPVMMKYYVIEGLYAQVGPQLSVSTSASTINDIIQLIPDAENFAGIKTLGVDLGFGAGYDVLDNLSVQMRYAIELTDRADGLIGSLSQIRVYNFNVGLTYFL